MKKKNPEDNSLLTKVQNCMTSVGNCTKHIKKDLYHSQAIPKIEEEGKFPKSFYEATITLIPKTLPKIIDQYLR